MEVLNAPIIAGLLIVFGLWVLLFLWLDVRDEKIMPWFQWRLIELLGRLYGHEFRRARSESPTRYEASPYWTFFAGVISVSYGIVGLIG